ncbi:hypothetical protein SteCoe_8017 [Stentor coeruleus]|uniref:SAM domain-containing protein n=1 Tax=Stentor coeruleus TaxID=5963 RepID=A0A1R2CLC4_9CILI|nr:hypothetical protein SteCoe_8017 [Stentor coeruleus]
MEKYQDPKQKPKLISESSQNPEKKPKENEVDKVLKELNLEKYSKIMQENGIDDMEIFQELTEPHLEQLGIVLGHRIKIMKKIRELNGTIEKNIIKSPMKTEPSPENQRKTLKQEGSIQYNNSSSSLKSLDVKPKVQGKSERNIKEEVKYSPNIGKSEAKEIACGSPPPEENIEVKPKVVKVTSLTPREFVATNNIGKGNKIIETNMVGKNDDKTPLVVLNKPPVPIKPVTVGKAITTYQPLSQEAEKNVKISEMLVPKIEENKKEEFKWDHFSYVPYKPSEEIQAVISKKPSSRPSSATHRQEVKTTERHNEVVKESIEVAGWDN